MKILLKDTEDLPEDMRGQEVDFLNFDRTWGVIEDVLVIRLTDTPAGWHNRWCEAEDVEYMPEELETEIMIRRMK